MFKCPDFEKDRYFFGCFVTYLLADVYLSALITGSFDKAQRMQHKRNGPLYSPIGCGTAMFLVIVLGIILYLRGGTPFSPGSLSAAQSRNESLGGYSSHADIEGDCGQCHEPWQGVTIDRCGNCHQSVLDERNNKTGLHGHLPDKEICQLCHLEHRGESSEITEFELDDFEHDWVTDFSLIKHQVGFDGEPLECADCHPDNKFTVDMIDCLGCHHQADFVFANIHAAFYGDDCQACHDGLDSMVHFDHQQSFRLEGAHTEVDCVGCHETTILAGTANECVGCHIEPEIHFGVFGQDCRRCHTTTAWKPAHLSQHIFPLNHGEEDKIECQTCHELSYTTYTCTNCHAHDPGETIAEHEDKELFDIADCANCHPTGLEDEAKEANAND